MGRIYDSYTAILLCTLVASPLACKSDSKISGEIKEGQRAEATQAKIDAKETEYAQSKDHAAAASSNAEPEIVSIPNAITGALLTCHAIEANDKVEVLVACRYENAEKQRVPLSAIAKEQSFSYSGTIPSGIVVTLLPADASYEVYFSFSGASFATLNGLVKTLQFNASLSGLVNGEPDGMLSGKGSDIVTAPVARWVRESQTDVNANGICDGTEVCIYIGNGMMWMRDTTVPKNHVDASLGCTGGVSGPYSGWSLPSVALMKMAYEKGIWDLADPSALSLSDSAYYSNEGAAPGSGLPEDTIYAVNLKTGLQTSQVRADILHFLCVRSLANTN